jgi:hypothetical protein
MGTASDLGWGTAEASGASKATGRVVLVVPLEARAGEEEDEALVASCSWAVALAPGMSGAAAGRGVVDVVGGELSGLTPAKTACTGPGGGPKRPAGETSAADDRPRPRLASSLTEPTSDPPTLAPMGDSELLTVASAVETT